MNTSDVTQDLLNTVYRPHRVSEQERAENKSSVPGRRWSSKVRFLFSYLKMYLVRLDTFSKVSNECYGGRRLAIERYYYVVRRRHL